MFKGLCLSLYYDRQHDESRPFRSGSLLYTRASIMLSVGYSRKLLIPKGQHHRFVALDVAECRLDG